MGKKNYGTLEKAMYFVKNHGATEKTIVLWKKWFFTENYGNIDLLWENFGTLGKKKKNYGNIVNHC